MGKEVKLIQLCISTYVDLSNHYSKPVKILLFVCLGFNLIWHGFCTKSTSATLLLGQETAIRTTKFCRQVLPYWYEQNLIICQNGETFGSYFLNIPKAFMTFIPNSELPLLIENLEPPNSRVTVHVRNITQSCNSVFSNWSNLRSNITTNFEHC